MEWVPCLEGAIWNVHLPTFCSFPKLTSISNLGPLVCLTVTGQGTLVLRTHEATAGLLERRGHLYSDCPCIISKCWWWCSPQQLFSSDHDHQWQTRYFVKGSTWSWWPPMMCMLGPYSIFNAPLLWLMTITVGVKCAALVMRPWTRHISLSFITFTQRKPWQWLTVSCKIPMAGRVNFVGQYNLSNYATPSLICSHRALTSTVLSIVYDLPHLPAILQSKR